MEIQTKLLFVIYILVKLTYGLVDQPCQPNQCVPVSCSSVCDGRMVHTLASGDFCSCCFPCSGGVDYVGKRAAGAACEVNNDVCGSGLHCDHASKTCVFTKRATGPCNQQLQEYLSNQQQSLGVAKPRCETDGTFSPKQCLGSGCYCADAYGNNIGYFTDYSKGADNMDCKCARDKNAYIKSGLIGKLFFCDKKGSYERVQCGGSVCYCADTDGKALTNSPPAPIQYKDKLNC